MMANPAGSRTLRGMGAGVGLVSPWSRWPGEESKHTVRSLRRRRMETSNGGWGDREEAGLSLSFLCCEMRRTVVLNGIIVRIQSFPHGSAGEESTCNAGDTGDADSIPGFMSTSPAGGHGNPLQCSCQKNSMDRGVWGWRGATVQGVAERPR